ncbi:MAG: hypothetical protein AMXMBFR83_03500 [Phycisphaerae bacterium]|jgi:RsiW-degrading membrane proteinase PrsW (M82 family)
MSDLLAVLLTPVTLTRFQQMLMLVPLCLAVSIVYKTTKCERVREIPWAAFVSCLTIIIGMYLVGIALMVLYNLVA